MEGLTGFVEVIGTVRKLNFSVLAKSYGEFADPEPAISYHKMISLDDIVKVQVFDNEKAITSFLTSKYEIRKIFFDSWLCEDDYETHNSAPKACKEHSDRCDHCTCKFKGLYPVYIIQTKKYQGQKGRDGKRKKYVVHPNHRNVMKQYLSHSESPIYGINKSLEILAQNLHFSVDFANELEVARERFDQFKDTTTTNKRPRNDVAEDNQS